MKYENINKIKKNNDHTENKKRKRKETRKENKKRTELCNTQR
jgi:hypothetical protein